MYPNSKLALADEAATLGYLRNIVLILSVRQLISNPKYGKRSAIRGYRETDTHMEIVGSIRNESEMNQK